VLLTQAQAGGGGAGDQDAIVNAVADNILKEVPNPFNVREAEKKYPVMYE
jgi:dynein heavy chain